MDRNKEYQESKKYGRFFVKTLVPWIDKNYNTLTEPTDRGVLGDALGGLASLHLAYTHPKVFGRVASQSGAFHTKSFKAPDGTKVKAAKISRLVKKAKTQPERIYISVGTYETVLENNRHLRDLLKEKDHEPGYRELPQGHTWTQLRETLPEALKHLWHPEEKEKKGD